MRTGLKRENVLIVGAGLSGLTAGAYLLRYGRNVTILEMSGRCGGLAESFEREGFLFDTGPRALGNGGILLPLTTDLELDLTLRPSPVSLGIGKEIIPVDGGEGIEAYSELLKKIFPDEGEDIRRLSGLLRRYSRLSSQLGRVPNPLLYNPLKDWAYLLRTFLPWFPSFIEVLLAYGLENQPLEKALRACTENPSLRDMVSQHFFKGTPAPFALGYFAVFRDYYYPVGGTGKLAEALEKRILSGGGRILTGREAVRVLPEENILVDRTGERHPYGELLWTGDLKSLYNRLDRGFLSTPGGRRAAREAGKFRAARPGESAFILFLAVDLPPRWFSEKSRGHLIYTPRGEGLGELGRSRLEEMKKNWDNLARGDVLTWLRAFCRRNSYEIGIPALRDRSLSPEGRTSLVVSFLFDGELAALIERDGWMGEFREETARAVIDILSGSLYPGLVGKILFYDTATPRTLARRFNTSNGAITGWSLEDKPPVVHSLGRILSSSRTAVPHVHRAGQWSYSPSGVPVALLTGRIAAGSINRALTRSGKKFH